MFRDRKSHVPFIVGAVLALLALPAAAPAATLTLASGLGLTHAGNLVVNGSFENQASGHGFFHWATGTTLTPYEPVDFWSSSGGPDNYSARDNSFTASGSGPLPDGVFGLYFGNSFVTSISQTPTFLANGRVQFTSPPTIVPSTGYSPPVQLSQAVGGLNPGNLYGLSFWASGEAASFPTFTQDGLFALDVTGFDREYLAAPSGSSALGVGHVYEFTFVPSGSSVTLTFTNWGHYADQGGTTGWTLPSTTELVLDDIILNDLGPAPEPATVGLLAAGAMAVLCRRRRGLTGVRHF